MQFALIELLFYVEPFPFLASDEPQAVGCSIHLYAVEQEDCLPPCLDGGRTGAAKRHDGVACLIVEMMMESIRNNAQWYEAVEKQAKERGITVEENLRRNAIYAIRNREKANP